LRSTLDPYSPSCLEVASVLKKAVRIEVCALEESPKRR